MLQYIHNDCVRVRERVRVRVRVCEKALHKDAVSP